MTAKEEKKNKRKENLKGILFGILWCVGGFVATAVSMDMASAGDTYYLFYGAVLYGIWEIISGLFGLIKNSI
jgi:uncharacterized membrane protein